MSLIKEDKHRCETQAKDSLRKLLEEKIEAVQKLADVERSLENTEEECARLREQCEFAHNELSLLAQKHNEALVTVEALQSHLHSAEQRVAELTTQLYSDRADFESKIAELSRQESIFTSRIEALQNENDFSKEQIAALRGKIVFSEGLRSCMN